MPRGKNIMPEPAAPRPRAGDGLCCVCGKPRPYSDLTPAALVRSNIADLIAAACPGWDAAGHVCHACLNQSRGRFVRAEMERDIGALTALEEEVMHSLHGGAIVTDNTNGEFDGSRSFGERIADKVAEFGGSWRFIILFFAGIAVWIVVNTLILLKAPFDPYPYSS